MSSLETWIGLVVTVIVMPAAGFIAALSRRQHALDKRVTKVETDQTWLSQSVLKVEATQNAMRAEVNEKLDMLTEHLLKGKK